MDCGMTCVKYLVFIFNLLFALSGLVILITGAVIQAGYKEYLQFVPNEIFSAPLILIVVGVVIFVIAFFGCCGAMKENNCMILTFSVLLGIIFILEVSAGIAAYVMRSELEQRIEDKMLQSIVKYNPDAGNSNVATESWDLIQHELKCCGANGPEDWEKNDHYKNKTTFPLTCCSNMRKDDSCTKTEDLHTVGCLSELTRQIKDNISVVGGVGVGIAFLQLIGIVFACCLSKGIRRDYETV